MAVVTLPVVVWSHTDKRIESCSVSVDSTFQDVIVSFGLHNIHNALVGQYNASFHLMAGDFTPDNDYDPHDK